MLSKHEFFEAMDRNGLALSYDDVTIITDQSRVLPSQVKLDSWFSRRVHVRLPISSSPMDTVTGYLMAIAMAEAGGIGIIHKNLTPDEQAAEVARVKFRLNGLISKPITVSDSDTVEAILNRRQKKNWGFHSFPVLNPEGKLIGIITGKNILMCDNYQLLARDIMTKNIITAPAGTNMDTAYALMMKHGILKLPLKDDAGNLSGMYVFTDVKRNKAGNSEGFNLDANGQLRVGAAIGS